MIKTKDEMEKIVPSAEEEEKEEEVEKEKEEDGKDSGDEDKEAEVKTAAAGGKPQPAAKKKKKAQFQPAAKTKKKAQSDVLNLNNEVVRMRKEVKRVRALVIRKLTRQLAALKKKKGKETEIERNHRRAARLLEEIHAMKDLSPDLVTKTALQKNLNFEKVCKNPTSTISDRATARIATHPQFSKKIENIKAAVKTFKDERRKGGKPVEQKKEQNQDSEQNQAEKTTKQSPNKQEEEKSESEEEERAATPQKVSDDEVGPGKDSDDAAVDKTEEETCSEAPAVVQPHKINKSTSVKPPVVETCDLKDSEKDELQSEVKEKQLNLKAAPTVVQEGTDDQESDVESSDDEEKEYFDDSTEERFHKQSSQSEESDDDDDFFVGKVSKFKKKKKKDEGEAKREEEKKDSTDSGKPSDKLQKELDELESRLKSKASSFQSVFCSSLAAGKAGRGGANDRGRGDRFRGRGRPQGGSAPNREFSQQARFQKQQKDSEGNSVSKYSRPCPEARRSESSGKGFEFAGRGRGRGRGRGDSFRQRESRGRGVFSHQAPQEALHPSWEASKKRKEQQGQILAFQGKKIKFDDDD